MNSQAKEGVFTTIKVENGKIHFWQEHMKNLQQSCVYGRISFEKPSIIQALRLIDKKNAYSGVWRLKVMLKPSQKPSFCLDKENDYPKESLRIEVYPHAFSGFRYKSLSFSSRLMALQQVISKGYDEGLCFDEKKQLLEGFFSNIFFLKEGTACFPHPNLAYYQGVTVKRYQASLKDRGFCIEKGYYQLEDIITCEGAFMCNAIKGVRRVKSIYLKGEQYNIRQNKGLLDELKHHHQSHLQQTNNKA